MEDRTITRIERNIDYKFDNKKLLEKAFIRKSYSFLDGEDNELLVNVGNKVLDIIIIKILMERFTIKTTKQNNEFNVFGRFPTKYGGGYLKDIRRQLGKNQVLSKCADNLGLTKHLLMGTIDRIKEIQKERTTKDELFEAIVGAVTIDSKSNLRVVEEVVKTMIDFDEFFNTSKKFIPYVSEIQRWSLICFNELPSYSYGRAKDVYRCTLYLDGCAHGFYSEGKNKLEARFLAAKEAYEYLDGSGRIYYLKKYVGEANFIRAINQLQELYQKERIPEPIYEISEDKDTIKEERWRCKAYLDDVNEDDASYAYAPTKKQAKKKAAYDLLVRVLKNDIVYYMDLESR